MRHATFRDTKVAWYDVSFLVFDLICSAASASMGCYFAEAAGKKACKLDVPLYLIIVGAGNFVLSIVRFTCPVSGSMLQLALNFGLIIYGGHLVFGYWQDVDFDNEASPYYCNEIPYTTAVNSVSFFVLYYLLGIVFYSCCCVWIYWLHCRHSAWAYRYSSGYIYGSLHYVSTRLCQQERGASANKKEDLKSDEVVLLTLTDKSGDSASVSIPQANEVEPNGSAHREEASSLDDRPEAQRYDDSLNSITVS